MLSEEQLGRIRNVIIVMMENRSFDHMLGYLSLSDSGYANWHQIEGVRQALAAGYTNRNPIGERIAPCAIDAFWNPAKDPPHERDPIAKQLGIPFARGVFPMDGFVQSYYEANANILEPNVVGYYGAQEVGTFDFFAKNFLVCDRWFAPLPASTQPNRLMALSGYTLRDYTGNLPDVADQHLVYDWLDGKAQWEVYCDGHPFIAVIPKRMFTLVTSPQFKRLSELNPATLPPVTFIEPRYTNDIATGAAQCDDHWPSAIHQGQLFLFRVYEALFGQGDDSNDLWSGCVMIVTYDEHGGYFDHVSPLSVGTPLPHGASYDRPFFTTGIRVPAFVISPFVTSGSVSSVNLDHTSILKFLGRKFGGGQYQPWVDDRTGVGSVDDVLDNFSNPVAEPPKFGDVDSQAALDHAKWMASRPASPGPVEQSSNSLAIEDAARRMWNDYPSEFEVKYPEIAGVLKRLPRPK
jgi:phospholipase C